MLQVNKLVSVQILTNARNELELESQETYHFLTIKGKKLLAYVNSMTSLRWQTNVLSDPVSEFPAIVSLFTTFHLIYNLIRSKFLPQKLKNGFTFTVSVPYCFQDFDTFSTCQKFQYIV